MPPFRTDIIGHIGGDVIIYVRDCLTHKRLAELEIRGVEAIW